MLCKFNSLFSFFQVRATLLNDDEEALKQLREKEERKQAKEDRKKRAEEKKKDVAKKRKTSASRRLLTLDSDEEDAPDTQMRLDDSSEYSDELQEEDAYLTPSQYPFASKEPEVMDFLSFLSFFFIYFKSI